MISASGLGNNKYKTKKKLGMIEKEEDLVLVCKPYSRKKIFQPFSVDFKGYNCCRFISLSTRSNIEIGTYNRYMLFIALHLSISI